MYEKAAPSIWIAFPNEDHITSDLNLGSCQPYFLNLSYRVDASQEFRQYIYVRISDS